MLIYTLFLGFILFTAVITGQIKDTEKRKNAFLFISFAAIFLLYSLRASSVGRDLPGYEQIYLLNMPAKADDLALIQFERGYMLLMKICYRLGFDFQLFLTTVNAIILVPIYFFIKKYSKHPLISVLIYMGYQFFQFNMTGLRQAIATSIVLCAFMAVLECKKYPLLKYILLVVLASQFHSGAFIAFFYVPFHFLKHRSLYVSAISVFAVILLILRRPLMVVIKHFFEKETLDPNAGISIGLNFIFLFTLGVIFVICDFNRKSDTYSTICTPNEELYGDSFSLSVFGNKTFLLGLVTFFLFGTGTALRSAMILYQTILVLLPNCVDKLLPKRFKGLALLAISLFFCAFYFSNLSENSFDIVPYKFFWQ